MVPSNEKLTGELSIVKYVNAAIAAKIKKCQAKAEHYSRRNNAEINGIPDILSSQDIEKTVT